MNFCSGCLLRWLRLSWAIAAPMSWRTLADPSKATSASMESWPLLRLSRLPPAVRMRSPRAAKAVAISSNDSWLLWASTGDAAAVAVTPLVLKKGRSSTLGRWTYSRSNADAL